MMNDKETTMAQVSQLVANFVDQRDWNQFHSPKNLSMALSIEAGELMEHFQWISMEESREVVNDQKRVDAIAEEVADVLSYTVAIARQLNIDLAATIEKKMEKNRLKYPVEEFKGRYGNSDTSGNGASKS